MSARGRWAQVDDPRPPASARAVELAAFVTVGLLALTESFVQLPAAVVAFAAARFIASSRDRPDVRPPAGPGTPRTPRW